MADEHKHDESVIAPEPAVEMESLMDKISEKIHHGGDSSSMKSKVYRLFGREKPVHKVLGGGKAADIFMWKNKKMSGRVLGGATAAAWLLFELMEYHFLDGRQQLSYTFSMDGVIVLDGTEPTKPQPTRLRF